MMSFSLSGVGVLLVPIAYYLRTRESFAAVIDICPRLFCDFVDYYYPMGQAVFRTEFPVPGFLYSPFNAILLSLFPLLGLDSSLVVWGMLQAVSVSLYALLFRRLVPAGPSAQLLFVVLSLSSYPLLLNFVGGQVSVFMMVAVLGILVLYERGRRMIGAGLVAFAVSFKFYPIIFLAPFAIRRDTRFVVAAAALCGLFLLVVPGAFLGASDTLRFYGGLFDAFRASNWVVNNPHSQFFPHVVLRLAAATGYDVSAHLSLLQWIAWGVAAVNLGFLFLIQHAGLRHTDLWSFQILFLTIPFILKTSWPHDFVFLPFSQAFLVWQLLERTQEVPVTDSADKGPQASLKGWRIPHLHVFVTVLLLLPSIVISNIVFFDVFGHFSGYGYCAFLFWADLLLLMTLYILLLPDAVRQLRERNEESGHPRTTRIGKARRRTVRNPRPEAPTSNSDGVRRHTVSSRSGRLFRRGWSTVFTALPQPLTCQDCRRRNTRASPDHDPCHHRDRAAAGANVFRRPCPGRSDPPRDQGGTLAQGLSRTGYRAPGPASRARVSDDR